MSVIEQFKPIIKTLDEIVEVLEKVPAPARLALLAYLQLIALRTENKTMKEYDEVTMAAVEFLMFAMQTKAQRLCEGNNDEENKN